VDSVRVWTIGHSDSPLLELIERLRQHSISLVADVRSQPYSQWAPQFNRENLAHGLEAAGIAYRYLGDELGGRPAGGGSGGQQPDYDRLAKRPQYLAGIEELLALAEGGRVAVLCSEGDHRQCHRHLLISQTLLKRGVQVTHIQPDGSTVPGERILRQLSLFGKGG